MIWVVLVVGVIVVVVVVRLAMSKRQPDGVDSFRRQIDALSPDARRSIVGRVNEAAERDAEAASTDTGHDPGDGTDPGTGGGDSGAGDD